MTVKKRIEKSRQQQTLQTDETNVNTQKYISIPYIPGTSETLRRIFPKHNIKCTFYSNHDKYLRLECYWVDKYFQSFQIQIETLDLQIETLDLQIETLDIQIETLDLQIETLDLQIETLDLQTCFNKKERPISVIFILHYTFSDKT